MKRRGKEHLRRGPLLSLGGVGSLSLLRRLVRLALLRQRRRPLLRVDGSLPFGELWRCNGSKVHFVPDEVTCVQNALRAHPLRLKERWTMMAVL